MAAPSPPTGAPPPSSSTPPPVPSSSPPPISIPPPVLPPVPSPPIPGPPPVVPSSPPLTTPPPVVPVTPPPTSPVLPPPPQSPPSPPIPPLPQPPPSPSLVPPPKPSPSPPITPPTATFPPPPSLVPPPKPSPSPPITPPTVTSPPPSPETPSPPPSSGSTPRTPPILPKAPPPPPPNAQPPQDSSAPPVSSPGPPVRLSPPPPANSTEPLPVSPSVPSTPNSPNSLTPTSSSNSPPATPNNSGGGLKTEAIVGIGAAVVIFLLLGALIVWCLKSKKKDVRRYVSEYVMPPANGSPSQVSESTHQSAPLVKSSSSQGYSSSPREPGPGISKGWFAYEELSAITDGFSSQNILGEGGFGCVYKGCLPDGRDVAVKQLKVGGGQGEREFQAEVEIISRVHHRHLVSLVGYCISENQRLLVYDYVPNNTLHYHLHGDGSPVMDWTTRIKIAAGAARGIAYLHEACHPRIIHRDIKSSNILLDNSFEALVSDFGLAKLTVDAQTHVTTRVMGTFGYMAPEYASSGKLTDRSDVFSFGVVLLELITGRKPVDTSQPVGDESLVQWARQLMSLALETGNFEGLPDPRLQGNYSEHEMLRLIETAAACVRHSASMRPRMGVIMRALDNLNDNLDLQNGVRPGQSELFNTGPNSEDIRIFNMMAYGGQAYTSDFSHSGWSDHREF